MTILWIKLFKLHIPFEQIYLIYILTSYIIFSRFAETFINNELFFLLA
jgi:hypothetical protein